MSNLRYFTKSGKLKSIEADKVAKLYVHKVGATTQNGVWELPNKDLFLASEIMVRNNKGLFQHNSGDMCPQMRKIFQAYYAAQTNFIRFQKCPFTNQKHAIWEFKTEEVANQFAYMLQFVYGQRAEFVNPEEPAYIFIDGEMVRRNIADFPENFDSWGWQDVSGMWINAKDEGYTEVVME